MSMVSTLSNVYYFYTHNGEQLYKNKHEIPKQTSPSKQLKNTSSHSTKSLLEHILSHSQAASRQEPAVFVHVNEPALRTVSFTNDSSLRSEYSLQECPTLSQSALLIVYLYCKMQPMHCMFGMQIKYCSDVNCYDWWFQVLCCSFFSCLVPP